ncbi:alpha/beta fold hydrolase [Streptomyces sp. WMMC1477]|uniref:alpha/beta fold hydrolase n=1 Tax=Streptomyces sp. WMMC1477 TaxID=3015155 RepID=UPI0022B5F71E|nr:alpha/beta hydrolase [Streptomyces sp. WMMC1477]MCZ7431938.1 alpha/beta hydrolase [Streptomyces sp. WMMC1477]
MTEPAPVPAREYAVPVRGGRLAVTHWPGRGEAADVPGEAPVPDEAPGPGDVPVLALHGITANGHAFTALAEALSPRLPLHAPDLRGRAHSAALPGPYGLAAHVEDVLGLLRHLGRERAVLVGHSMGAFVAALAAARHPERFPHVVLVDGGLGFPPPDGTDIDALLDAVIGPAMRRLRMTFPDRAAYRAFFRSHPAFTAHWGPHVQAYVDRDLVGDPPALRSSCVLDAVRADGADVLRGPEVLAAVHRPGVRATLLWAERGLLDEPQGLYDETRLAAAGPDPGRVAAHRLPDTNHYSTVLTPAAVAAVADAVHRAHVEVCQGYTGGRTSVDR